jgi:hypothetical protein
VESSCEYSNEPPGPIKCWEVLEWLDYWRVSDGVQVQELPEQNM